MGRVLLVCLFCLSTFCFAEVSKVNLIKITNDIDREVSYMYVKTDEDFNIKNFGYLTFLDKRLIEQKEFSNNLDHTGVVLEKQKGRDIIILRGLNVDYRYGGSLEVDFLYNGITGSRGKYTIELDKNSDSWQISKDGRVVNQIHMIANRKPFVGVVGIKKIKIVK